MRSGYFAIAQFLQSACAMRCIEFRDGCFYCEDEEVTGKKFIVDLRKLNFGSVTHEENRTVTVREGRSLWDCSPDHRKSSNENKATLGKCLRRKWRHRCRASNHLSVRGLRIRGSG
jgi:hypothetical protein